jgi:archaeosine synthase
MGALVLTPIKTQYPPPVRCSASHKEHLAADTAKPVTTFTTPPFYHPAFEVAFRSIVEDYPIPSRRIALFIPCALRKPYSTSPSHRLFHRVIGEALSPASYHLVIFGTCGVVPAELELMYPFAHYHYMLGKCPDDRVKQDFLSIETYRLSLYLKRTEECYRVRVAYCIGLFREAMARASLETGIGVTLFPSQPVIAQVYDIDCPFPEGSLSREEYIEEFRTGLQGIRDRLA